jgi:hypothetical protein
MEDVGRTPPPSSIAVQETSSINELDGWISTLMQCKQLSEIDVQRLCEKVRTPGCCCPCCRSVSSLSPLEEEHPGTFADLLRHIGT